MKKSFLGLIFLSFLSQNYAFAGGEGLSQKELQKRLDILEGQVLELRKLIEVKPKVSTSKLVKTNEGKITTGFKIKYLKPTTEATNDFAIVIPSGKNYADGKTYLVDFDWSDGYEYSLGYRFPSSNYEISFIGNTIDDTTSLKKLVRDSTMSRIEVSDCNTSNACRGTSEGDFITGQNHLEIGDFKLNMDFQKDEKISYFAGLRYLGVEQKKDSYFYDISQSTGTSNPYITVNRRSYFSGFGPYVGVSHTQPVLKNLSLKSKASSMLLWGETNASISQETDSNSSNTYKTTRSKKDLFTPGYELEVALDYTKPIKENLSFGLSGGYEFKQFYDVIDDYYNVDDVNDATYSSGTTNMNLSGVFAKFDFKYSF